ncbi:ABC transporter permease [Mesoterricola sediminis]|uniref:Sodium ABC transporter permease n=1 Tax=Mesoterricola sediminis TaxID=2927980 RepID=A0AA48GYS4_9BACT|nr:ABC transporter permease [Mesoterricola sediminis]BDU76890.1 sodium ABC transporter permease [Mesoterricola sediminis]
MRGALLIVKKEFLELSKDRKTLFFTFLMPLILYPLLFTMMGRLGKSDEAKRASQPSRVWVAQASPAVTALLAKDPASFTLAPRPEGDVRQALRDQKLELILEPDPQAAEKEARSETWSVKAVYDRSDDSSRLAVDRLKKALAAHDKTLVQARLKALGASPQLAEPTKVDTEDAGGKERAIGKMLGSFLPYILMIMMYAGAMQHGIYATAGEKERGTLLSLLSTSIPRSQIIIGKLLYVFSIGLIVALINLLSMAFSVARAMGEAVAQGAPAAGGAAMPGLAALASPSVILLSFLLVVPLGLFFANFIILGGIQARNTVEAGTALTPGVFVVVVLGVFSMAPGIEKMPILPYVPVLNVSLAIRKLFSQQANAAEYLIALVMTLGLACLMTWLSTRMLKRESAIFKV